ncbi:MAG: hypothetical protein M3O94_08580 [Actinomycetota bacterium]|nr:hypothetical protein [Actinomycetota bacterium]
MALADRVERASGLLAPAVALLSSSLMLCCLVTLPDIATGWPALSTADNRLPGWSGAALVVAVATTAISLLLGTRRGSGPPLARLDAVFRVLVPVGAAGAHGIRSRRGLGRVAQAPSRSDRGSLPHGCASPRRARWV